MARVLASSTAQASAESFLNNTEKSSTAMAVLAVLAPMPLRRVSQVMALGIATSKALQIKGASMATNRCLLM